jgi:MFS family permease
LSIILAIYLKQIGFDDILIGVILSVTLLNSVFFTLFASFYADRFGRRRILIIYAVLMSAAGTIFILTDNYLALIIAALIGTINVTGSETGAFLSIEQAILPQTVKKIKKRNTLFAFYNMGGTFAMSAGILLSGMPQTLQEIGWSNVESFKPLFATYVIAGLIVAILYLFLSKNIEVKNKHKIKSQGSPLKQLSPKSRSVIGKLSALFSLDSFAGGFVIQSIISFWFFTKFGVDLTTLSLIFSITGILTAFSYIIATRIADRIGLINTMVFTHIPANVLLVLLAFAPTFPIALGLHLARMTLSQMDVPTRQSYIVAVVDEDERTAAAGITNTSRNIAQAVSPSITGVVIQSLWLSAPFVIGGVLKIAYDIGVYFSFRKIKPSEEM